MAQTSFSWEQVNAWRLARTLVKTWAMHGTLHLLSAADLALFSAAREPLLPAEYQKLVYRPQGWVTALVLVDGYIRGTWSLQMRRKRATASVRMFSPPTVVLPDGIAAEVERVGGYEFQGCFGV